MKYGYIGALLFGTFIFQQVCMRRLPYTGDNHESGSPTIWEYFGFIFAPLVLVFVTIVILGAMYPEKYRQASRSRYSTIELLAMILAMGLYAAVFKWLGFIPDNRRAMPIVQAEPLLIALVYFPTFYYFAYRRLTQNNVPLGMPRAVVLAAVPFGLFGCVSAIVLPCVYFLGIAKLDARHLWPVPAIWLSMRAAAYAANFAGADAE